MRGCRLSDWSGVGVHRVARRQQKEQGIVHWEDSSGPAALACGEAKIKQPAS